MSMLFLYSSASILGAVFFLFLYWKKMREDYPRDIVFANGFSILTGVIIGTFLISFLFGFLPKNDIVDTHQVWFWGAVSGFLVAFLWKFVHSRFKFFESLEASGIGLFVWLGFIFVANGIATKNVDSLIASGLVFFLFIFYLVLEKKYRKFTWYKSGRVGFAGLTVLGLFFLTRTAIAVYGGSMLSLAGRVEVILSSVVAFLLFFAVYHLSETY